MRKEAVNNMTKFYQLFLLLTFTMHLFGSMWVYIGRDNPVEGWVQTKRDLLGESEGKDVDNFTVYIASIYWVMTTFTTVGYGDISGNTELEYFYQMIVEIIGIGFFAYLMGNINSLIV